MIGQTIGNYRIEGELGRGGQGVVYLASQTALRRLVALKVVSSSLSGDDQFLERFKREGISAANLKHPHVIPVYEAGEVENVAYLAMEYVDGPTLEELIQREGQLPVQRGLQLLRQVAEALDYAHERGFVHRDVKPGNVLLAQGESHAYLTDFGLTKAREAAKLTRPGVWMGTLEYIAPEQIRGAEVTSAADRYSLGAMAYEVLTGRTPFQREDRTVLLFAHLHDIPPPPSMFRPELGVATDEILGHAMAKSPEERYPTSMAMVDALALALSPISGRGPATPLPGTGWGSDVGPQTIPAASAGLDETKVAAQSTPPSSPPPPPPTVPFRRSETSPEEPFRPEPAGPERPAASGRRRWLLWGLAGLVVVAAAVVAVVLLAGGDDKKGATTSVSVTNEIGTVIPGQVSGWRLAATGPFPLNLTFAPNQATETAQAIGSGGTLAFVVGAEGDPQKTLQSVARQIGGSPETIALPYASGALFNTKDAYVLTFEQGDRAFVISAPTREAAIGLGQGISRAL
jgi:serine/threonine-protein kinase